MNWVYVYYMSKIVIPETVISILKRKGKNRELEEFEKLLEEEPDEEEIPAFHFSKESQLNIMANIISSIALHVSSRQLYNSYPNFNDIEQLRKSFEMMTTNKNSTKSRNDSAPKTLSYSQYKQLKEKWPQQLQYILSSRLFLEIGGQSNHTINVEELFKHLYLISKCVQSILKLYNYDPVQSDIINEDDFICYVSDSTSNFSFIDDVEEKMDNFRDYYCTFVAQRILVVLDPLRLGQISIQSLIKDPLYLYFVMIGTDYGDGKKNPFSYDIALSVAQEFEEIDSDDDGFLCPSDLRNLNGALLIPIFINKVFEIIVGDGDFDYTWFVRFRVSWDNLGAPWANAIFFDVMDIDADGFITRFDLNYYYRDLIASYKPLYPDRPPPSFEFITNEFFDMFGATLSISKENFIKSRSTESLVRQFVDLKAFVKCEANEDINDF